MAKKLPTPKPKAPRKTERMTVPKQPRYAQAMIRYSFRTNRKSKAEVRLELEADFRGKIRPTEVREHPIWSGWFYVVTFEVLADGIPGSLEEPYPLLDPASRKAMNAAETMEFAERAFSTLKPHFRCPLCWPKSKGKALHDHNQHKKGAVTMYNCRCDACGCRFQSRVTHEYTLKGQSIYID